MSDSIQSLSKGFTSTSETSSSISTILIFIAVMGGAYLAFRLISQYAGKGQKKSAPTASAGSGMLKMPQLAFRRPPEFTSAQRKVISDIISEFKKREFLAEAVPFAVLEKFAEYFYVNIKRLKMSKSEMTKMLIASYPIVTNSKVEIETVINGRLYLFERKVLSVAADRFATEPFDPNMAVLPKGASVLINFSKGREFISGESNLLRLAGDRMIFSYPKNLKIYNERRYARIPVQYVEGKIFSSQMAEPQAISVKDLSLEGIRIKTSESLKKKVVYKLSFSEIINGVDYSFPNLEGIVSKSFVAEKGYNEYGMAFLYLDIDTKTKLANYLRILADRIKAQMR